MLPLLSDLDQAGVESERLEAERSDQVLPGKPNCGVEAWILHRNVIKTYSQY